MTGDRTTPAPGRSAGEDVIDELSWLCSPAAERIGEAERLTRFCTLVPIVLVYARADAAVAEAKALREALEIARKWVKWASSHAPDIAAAYTAGLASKDLEAIDRATLAQPAADGGAT